MDKQSKSRILFIEPFFPFPINSGGHQAIYNGILAIMNDFDVSIAYEANDDSEYREAEHAFLTRVPDAKLYPLFQTSSPSRSLITRGLRRMGNYLLTIGRKTPSAMDDNEERIVDRWRTTVTPSSKRWIEHISNILSLVHFDVVQVEMPWRISDIFSLPNDVKRVYVHHELGFVCRMLEMSMLPNCYEYAEAVRKYVDLNEINQLNQYDAIITLSEVDSRKLLDMGVLKPIFSSFAIVDSPVIDHPAIGDGTRLTFVGPESHNPNLVGITWFLEKCWAKLKVIDPEMTFDIIGRWSDETINLISSKYPDVHFLGYVENLRDTIKGSTLIVPITVGSGIRMKILDAAASGVPFVSTQIGAEGIPVVDGRDCFIADSPEVFVEDIINLKDDTIRQKFIINARHIIETKYSISALRRNRLEIYRQVLEP